MTSILRQVRAIMTPARIWKKNLTPEGILCRSSVAPVPKMMIEAINNQGKLFSLRKCGGKKKKSI